MRDIEKAYIRAYIQNHNINRPIEYTITGIVAAPIISFLFTFLGYKELSEHSVVDHAFIMINVACVIVGFILKRKIEIISKSDKRISLYKANQLLYVQMTLMIFGLEYYVYLIGNKKECMLSLLMCLVVCVLTNAVMLLIEKDKVKKGYFSKKANNQKGNNEMVWIIIMVIVWTLFRTATSDDIVVSLCIGGCVGISAFSAYYATIYGIKLKYAKDYGMEEDLPTRPIPSRYTNWL